MRYLGCLLVFCFWVNIGYSQLYKSLELREIGHLLETNSQKYNYEIRHDDSGVITHIGLPVFNKNQHRDFPAEIYDFVERYNLYLRLLNPADREQFIVDKKLDVDPLKFFLTDTLCNFSIHETPDRYSIIWKKNEVEVCKFSFEKSYCLITGLNITESQQEFRCEILDTAKHYDFFAVVDYKKLKPSEDKQFKILEGTKYQIDAMSSNLYFDAKGKEPLNDFKFPVQTVANLFGGLFSGNFKLHITHNLYNYSKVEYDVELHRFVSYCLLNDCNFYFGVESIDEDNGKIKASVVYENTKLGYNHLLSIDFDSMILLTKKGVINCSLTTFIPTHNLKNLYYEKSTKK